jgi:hypothetical protein
VVGVAGAGVGIAELAESSKDAASSVPLPDGASDGSDIEE